MVTARRLINNRWFDLADPKIRNLRNSRQIKDTRALK